MGAIVLAASFGCSRTALPARVPDGSTGPVDALWDRPASGGAGGSDGAADGVGAQGGAVATGGARPTGGQGGGAGVASGGSQVTGGRGGGQAGVPSGGTATAGSGGGGVASGGMATGDAAVGSGGTMGGSGGTGSGGAARDASDGPRDSARPDGAVPLWRDSYQPFAQSVRGYYPLVASLWSDSRGVFVLTADDQSTPAIWSNLGQGWQMTYAWPEGTVVTSGPGRPGLEGFAGGALISIGVSPCSIQLVDEQGARCSGVIRDVADVVALGADLAYAAYSDRILRFDGSFWTQWGDPLPTPAAASFGPVRVNSFWTDGSTMVIATYETGTEGFVYLVGSGGSPVLQTGLPKVGFTSAWGFGADDLWVGSADGGLYHYDGSGWSLRASMTADGYGIMKLWGSAGELFMATSTELARWNGTSLETIDSAGSGRYYKDLWGNSTKEVFVTLIDFEDSANRQLRARWFDGTSLRPL